MPKSSLRPPAGHESADVRVVAPINGGQQGDTRLHRFANRYAVELLFAQLFAVLLNVAAVGLSVTKLLGVCS